MATTPRVRRAFARLASQADEDISVLHGALLIAMEEYPDCDPAAVEDKLDELADRVCVALKSGAGLAVGGLDGFLADVLAPPPTRRQVVEALNQVLFAEEGFCGAVENYADPRNSFLNEVLTRHTGIPITLSLLYMEVARRAGFHLVGIGMPGHFIVGFPPVDSSHDELMLYVDPFNCGAILTLSDCRAYFHRLYGNEYPFSREVLAPITNQQILSRVLNNLKQIYLEERDYRRALAAVDRLLLLQPDALWELKLRGLLYYRLGAFLPALGDLRRYLKRAPQSEETPLLRYYVDLLSRLVVAAN